MISNLKVHDHRNCHYVDFNVPLESSVNPFKSLKGGSLLMKVTIGISGKFSILKYMTVTLRFSSFYVYITMFKGSEPSIEFRHHSVEGVPYGEIKDGWFEKSYLLRDTFIERVKTVDINRQNILMEDLVRMYVDSELEGELDNE